MEYAENTVNIHDTITKKILGALEVLLGTKFTLWFGESAVQVKKNSEDNVESVSFTVRNRFAADWIKNNFGKELEQVCVQIFDKILPVHFVIGGSPHSPLKTSPKSGGTIPVPSLSPAEILHSGNPVYSAVYPAPAEPAKSPIQQPQIHRIQGHKFHSLSTFVEGISNRLACRAADLALNHPGQFNPIYISGPSSVGKTHILEGIWTGYRIRKDQQALRTAPLYMTAEQFTSAFMEAIQPRSNRNGIAEFRNKFKNISVLLLDDIQYFIGKDATQGEFLHTIDSLQNKGIQIVLTGCRPLPKLKNELKPEIICRIVAGMVCAVEQPERETSLKIVQNLVAQRKLPFGNDICRMVASRFGIHARSLNGAVNLLHAAYLTTGEPLSLKAAEETLAKLESYQRRSVRLQDVNQAVCETFGLSEEALKSKSRIEPISTARTLAMFLSRKYTKAALAEIGNFFGGRSHSTVISAQKKVDSWVGTAHHVHTGHSDVPVSEAIQRIERFLQSQ
ncbi:chromosomal replication initiator protein DnaA [Planctomycetales bacterium]|nr:chromosomal replication initiator protein DnaA [Planctomycetales bacterium]